MSQEKGKKKKKERGGGAWAGESLEPPQKQKKTNFLKNHGWALGAVRPGGFHQAKKRKITAPKKDRGPIGRNEGKRTKSSEDKKAIAKKGQNV